MKRPSPAPRRPARSPVWPIAVQALLLVALVVSSVLLWKSLAGGSLPGCGAESGCDAVMRSRWASLFGIPVSLPAIALYLATLAGVQLLKGPAASPNRRALALFLCGSGAAMVGAALWFTALQALVIHAFCRFCMTAHACGTLAGMILLTRVPLLTNVSDRRDPAPPTPVLPIGRAAMAALVGLLAVALSAVGQSVYRPKTYAVQEMAAGDQIVTHQTPSPASPPSAASSSPSAAAIPSTAGATNLPLAASSSDTPAAAAVKPEARSAPQRLLMLHGDLFTLDLDSVPARGSTNARHAMVHLFDYSCHYCRQLHPILNDAWRRLSNDLVLVSLPMPMNSNCNPNIRTWFPVHSNACEYARIALAVWRAKREIGPEFDDWMFGPELPPSPAVARAEAIRLVGSNAFVQAQSDPWIQGQLDLSMRLFATNRARYRKSSLPQLMIGSSLVSGVIGSNQLERMLGGISAETNGAPK